jgi:transposase
MAGKYDREFKLEAIRIASEEGARATDVERRLSLSQGMISRWKRPLGDEGADAFPGKGHLSVHDEQVRHLQRENERLRRERDILKKALAIFIKDDPVPSGAVVFAHLAPAVVVGVGAHIEDQSILH